MTIPRVLLLTFVLAACSSACPEPKDFHEMNFQQKSEYMAEQVFPRMEALFMTHDKPAFVDFQCKTCHGPSIEKGIYAMPNPDLPSLLEMKQTPPDPNMVAFMVKQVTPVTDALLGDKHEEVNCGTCHPAKPQK